MPPPLTEFGPVVEQLTAIKDLLSLQLAVTSTPPGKKPRLPRPSLRPVTAADRRREQRAEARRQLIAAQLWPHN